MANSGETFQIPTTSYHPPNDDDPLLNLSNLRSKMDTLNNFLSHTLTTNTPLSQPQLLSISGEISVAIRHVIINAAALISSAPQNPSPPPVFWPMPNSPLMDSAENGSSETKLQVEKTKEAIFINDWDIVELDSVELLAEHTHFCDICGKGFKRDANLRMHMRAHGFKTPGALSKPAEINRVGDNTRFSCPYIGCCRNKGHDKFRPLKSAICAKNHFKRSHCPKMYTCNMCNKKSFSVLADLKSHLKHCGEAKWKCSCGTTFSRKDKLFGHVALFEGHMPAVREEGERESLSVVAIDDDDESENKDGEKGGSFSDNGFFDGLIDGFGDTSNGFNLQDVLGMGSPSGLGNSMDEFFEF